MFMRLDTTGRTTVQPPSCSKRSPPRLPLSQWANGTMDKDRRIDSTHFITGTRGKEQWIYSGYIEPRYSGPTKRAGHSPSCGGGRKLQTLYCTQAHLRYGMG